jgi:hypothetical protein
MAWFRRTARKDILSHFSTSIFEAGNFLLENAANPDYIQGVDRGCSRFLLFFQALFFQPKLLRLTPVQRRAPVHSTGLGNRCTNDAEQLN